MLKEMSDMTNKQGLMLQSDRIASVLTWKLKSGKHATSAYVGSSEAIFPYSKIPVETSF